MENKDNKIIKTAKFVDNNQEIERSELLKTINLDGIKMIPKWHFILKSLLVFFGIIALILLILYIISFIIFILHKTGLWFIPAFGFRGWRLMFFSLPWMLILISIIFIIILEIFFKHYPFTYRYPLLYSTLGLIFITFFASLIISFTPFHLEFSKFSQDNNIPLAGNFYHTFESKKINSLHRGNIEQADDNQLIIRNKLGEILRVIIASSTRLMPKDNFSNGDSVLILGNRHGDIVQPFGIEEIFEDRE